MAETQAGRISARVEGRVQGVGFRYFVRTEAMRLQLNGWVRNERDGTVAVVAEGPRVDLDTLVDRLRVGPPTAAVRHVTVSRTDVQGEEQGFRIR